MLTFRLAARAVSVPAPRLHHADGCAHELSGRRAARDEAVLMFTGIRLGRFFYRDGRSRACVDVALASAPDHIAWGFRENRKTTTIVSRRESPISRHWSRRSASNGSISFVHDWGGAIGFCFATRHPGAESDGS